MQDPALSGASIGNTASFGLLRSGRPSPLTRAERVRRFGVDCSDALEWVAGWEPGGEYVKLLTVKNVSSKVMKIKYRLPESKFFNMAFPETIKLTPGLSQTLRVCAPIQSYPASLRMSLPSRWRCTAASLNVLIAARAVGAVLSIPGVGWR